MQSLSDQESITSVKGLKQVKVDNWGTFFLQRLLQLYVHEELLDLKIKFQSTNNVLNVHKLVIATCTDYFLQLEREQNCDDLHKNVIIMPSDMPYECVKSIISFMYTGQLEYWTSEQNALYYTAKKMNITVLTKLLDAQLETNVIHDTIEKKSSFQVLEQSLSSTKSLIKSPAQLNPENRFMIWKKNAPDRISKNSRNNGYMSYGNSKYSADHTEGPSRFDLPEVEELTLGVFSSFDDITYNTKPILQAPEKNINDKNSKNILTDTLCNMFVTNEDSLNSLKDDLKNDSYDDYWTESDSLLKFETVQNPIIKKRRYDLNEKENREKSVNRSQIFSNITTMNPIQNHAKIIREVLKKYPHLVQRNKNIRLKIMQKDSRNIDYSSSGKTKISYVVLKSEALNTNLDNKEISSEINDYNTVHNETGPWKCFKCDLEEQYSDYNMYRRHMQDVHGDKFDPRICEYCGYKASKRNILMYHMYTKHNVSLPKSISFPKCHACSYVALSESLLIKHQNNYKHQPLALDIQHSATNPAQCKPCEKKIVDTAELEHHRTCSSHESFSNAETKTKNNSSYKKHFKTGEILKIDCHENDKQNSYTYDMQNSQKTSREISDYTICKKIFTDDIKSKIQKCATNESDNHVPQKIIPIHNIETDDQQTLSMNTSDSQFEIYKEMNGPSQIFTNDQILVENVDDKVIIYIQNTTNADASEDLSTDIKEPYNQYSLNDHEIVEEVVEELEDVEFSKSEQVIKKKNMCLVLSKENENVKSDDHSLHSNNMSINKSKMKDEVQYVEEETEILEYET